jgi:mRNA interferase RelE/StbE
MTTVEYSSQARDHLGNFDLPVAERVMDKAEEAAEWTEHRLDPLTGWPYYTLRVGDYRAIIDWDRESDTLRVLAVGHRRNVYDRHLPP